MKTKTQSLTLPELVSELGISLEIVNRSHVNNESDWQKNANCFRVKVSYQGRSFSLNYYQGKGIDRDPNATSVIHSLASDHNILSSCDTAKCFGECFGWDEDTYKVYNAMKRQSARYIKLIGDPVLIELIGSKEY
jgi:hypothetical protein